jgi:hypothetical protein
LANTPLIITLKFIGETPKNIFITKEAKSATIKTDYCSKSLKNLKIDNSSKGHWKRS